MKDTVRIIGGHYRGKKISFPAHAPLRPTSSRVRETLFNWLMHNIRKAHCLDAFAGSGALGFEAFSRGAASVTFVETEMLVYQAIKNNALNFNSELLIPIHDDTLHFLKTTPATYDIIFLDPPFDSNLITLCTEIIMQRELLSEEGLLYIESANPPVLDAHTWHCLNLKKAGQVFYGLYSRTHWA